MESYLALLRKWQRVQNLVSRETLDMAWDRHILDSLQIFDHLTGTDIVDLGSGGGLPALPLAIASRQTGRTFLLSEPNERKAAFLRAVSRELDLGLRVTTDRAETLDSRETRADTITSRALAHLMKLLHWTDRLRTSRTRMVVHKGREHGEEILAASQHYTFDVLTVPSVTNEDAAILVIDSIRRRDRP